MSSKVIVNMYICNITVVKSMEPECFCMVVMHWWIKGRGGGMAPSRYTVGHTNDYGQNADYQNAEIVLAQQKHFI